MPTIYLNEKAKKILSDLKRPGQSWSGVIEEHLQGGDKIGKKRKK